MVAPGRLEDAGRAVRTRLHLLSPGCLLHDCESIDSAFNLVLPGAEQAKGADADVHAMVAASDLLVRRRCLSYSLHVLPACCSDETVSIRDPLKQTPLGEWLTHGR